MIEVDDSGEIKVTDTGPVEETGPASPTASHKELYGKEESGGKMTTEKYAISGLTNVLYIDLSSQSYHIEGKADLYEKYLGYWSCYKPLRVKSIKRNRSS